MAPVQHQPTTKKAHPDHVAGHVIQVRTELSSGARCFARWHQSTSDLERVVSLLRRVRIRCARYRRDGTVRIDFVNNFASLIHGHARPVIAEAVCEAVKNGTRFALPTRIEVEFAEILCERIVTFEKVRYCNRHRGGHARLEGGARLYQSAEDRQVRGRLSRHG
jgi:hypothetical protein